jgi:hypothetical protein
LLVIIVHQEICSISPLTCHHHGATGWPIAVKHKGYCCAFAVEEEEKGREQMSD